VFKAHRWLYHSTPGHRCQRRARRAMQAPVCLGQGFGFRGSGSGFRNQAPVVGALTQHVLFTHTRRGKGCLARGGLVRGRQSISYANTCNL